jgi:capsular polysaccharide biosynthesis protein
MSQPDRTLDPEAEQEIDFGRYLRLIATRWWLVAAGLILGAVIGYAVSLGGSQRWQSTVTLYLGQPYSASGNVQLQDIQTNPSTVRQIAHAGIVIQLVARHCKAKPGQFRGGISTQSVSGNIVKNGQTPLVTISVQTGKKKLATCAATELARQVVTRISAFANQKIKNFSDQVTSLQRRITAIDTALQSTSLGTTDKLVLEIQLGNVEDQRLSTSQLLLQAKQVEAPSVLTGASAQRITARSHRNTAVVAALIGAILGALVALLWDGIAASLQRRRTS